jgi:hypothetical protein
MLSKAITFIDDDEEKDKYDDDDTNDRIPDQSDMFADDMERFRSGD